MNDVRIQNEFIRPVITEIYQASTDLLSNLNRQINLTTPQQFLNQIDENSIIFQNQNNNRQQNQNQQGNRNNECNICFEQLNNNINDVYSAVYTLACEHSFCIGCIHAH